MTEFAHGQLNIAMLVRAFATDGGLELYCHRVVEGLLQRGHRVTVFCQNKRSDLEHEHLTFRAIEGRSDRLPKWQRLAHDHRAGNAAIGEYAAQFDIIHSQHYPSSFADVVTFHNHSVRRWSDVGLDWERLVNDLKSAIMPAYKLRAAQDRELCLGAKCRIFPSHVMQQDFYAMYGLADAGSASASASASASPSLSAPPFTPAPYMVAYPGASLPATIPDTASVRRPGQRPFTFLFVGRGFRRKGLDILLEACARLAKAGKHFRLLIAGLQAKPLDRLRLSRLGLGEVVEYLGFRGDMDVIYEMADAVVLPSRVEPFGMAPLQAMSFGLVPIVSRVSGVSEVLRHQHDCLILENHLDSSELAQLMDRLLRQPELVAQLRNNAPLTARRINWEETVTATLGAYQLCSP